MMALYIGFAYPFLVFGVALAIAVVFNAVAMSVSEERRDLATMKTLGSPTPRCVA